MEGSEKPECREPHRDLSTSLSPSGCQASQRFFSSQTPLSSFSAQPLVRLSPPGKLQKTFGFKAGHGSEAAEWQSLDVARRGLGSSTSTARIKTSKQDSWLK